MSIFSMYSLGFCGSGFTPLVFSYWSIVFSMNRWRASLAFWEVLWETEERTEEVEKEGKEKEKKVGVGILAKKGRKSFKIPDVSANLKRSTISAEDIIWL